MRTKTADRAEDETPGKRERNKAQKRRRILDAATDLFTEKGFETSTTAEISTAAGVGTGTLYLYFASKEDLLVEVFREQTGAAWERGFALVDPADPLIDQLLVVFGHVAEYHLEDPNLSRAIFREMMFATGSVRESCGEFVRDIVGRIEALLEEARRAGLVADMVDLSCLGWNLFAIWHYNMSRHLNDPVTDAGTLRSTIRTTFGTALAGLTP